MYQVVTRRQGPFPARIADVGVVKDLGTHDIDLTAWVTQQEFTSVAARTTHRSGREHEDMVSVSGKLTDGALAVHTSDFGAFTRIIARTARSAGIRLFELAPTDDSLESVFSYLVRR